MQTVAAVDTCSLFLTLHFTSALCAFALLHSWLMEKQQRKQELPTDRLYHIFLTTPSCDRKWSLQVHGQSRAAHGVAMHFHCLFLICLFTPSFLSLCICTFLFLFLIPLPNVLVQDRNQGRDTKREESRKQAFRKIRKLFNVSLKNITAPLSVYYFV